MEELTKIIQLLGADNEKRLRDSITDMLIENMQENINGMSVWLVDFEEMFEEIREEIKDDIMNRVVAKYMEAAKSKVDAIIQEGF